MTPKYYFLTQPWRLLYITVNVLGSTCRWSRSLTENPDYSRYSRFASLCTWAFVLAWFKWLPTSTHSVCFQLGWDLNMCLLASHVCLWRPVEIKVQCKMLCVFMCTNLTLSQSQHRLYYFRCPRFSAWSRKSQATFPSVAQRSPLVWNPINHSCDRQTPSSLQSDSPSLWIQQHFLSAGK